MKITYFLEERTEDVMNRIQERLVEDGYLYTRGELSKEVRIQNGVADQDLTFCEFWARKPLAPQYRDYYFIEISGKAERIPESGGTKLVARFVEMHHNRPHTGGGGASLDEISGYFTGILAAAKVAGR